jgi:hypothetical protein
MKVEIRAVRNGVVLRVEPEQPGDEAEEFVYQETDSDEIEAFADFLRVVLEHCGPPSNRYSPKRIHILVQAGDKYDPPDDSKIVRE